MNYIIEFCAYSFIKTFNKADKLDNYETSQLNNTNHFNLLPLDIKFYIFSMLDLSELMQLSLTCKTFKTVIADTRMKRLIVANFAFKFNQLDIRGLNLEQTSWQRLSQLMEKDKPLKNADPVYKQEEFNEIEDDFSYMYPTSRSRTLLLGDEIFNDYEEENELNTGCTIS